MKPFRFFYSFQAGKFFNFKRHGNDLFAGCLIPKKYKLLKLYIK